MKKILNIISTVLLIIILLLALLLFGVRLFGYTPYAVLSGSMTPSYSVGSIVYVKKCDADTICINDVITFMKNETTVVTHRVVDIDDTDGEFRFTTKGDANDFIDEGTVHQKNIIGKVSFSIPVLGYASEYISNPPGCYVAGVVVVILLFITFVPDLLFSANKEKDEEKSKEDK